MSDPISEVYLGRANTGGAVVFPQSKETAADFYLRDRSEKRRQQALIDAAAARAGKSELSKPEDVNVPDMFQGGLLTAYQQPAIDLYTGVKKAAYDLIKGGLTPEQAANVKLKVNQEMGKALQITHQYKADTDFWKDELIKYHKNKYLYPPNSNEVFTAIEQGTINPNTGQKATIKDIPQPLNTGNFYDDYSKLAEDIEFPKNKVDYKDPSTGVIAQKTWSEYSEPQAKAKFESWFNMPGNWKADALKTMTYNSILNQGGEHYDPTFLFKSAQDQQDDVFKIAYAPFQRIAQGKVSQEKANLLKSGLNLNFGNRTSSGLMQSNKTFNSVEGDDGIITVTKKGGQEVRTNFDVGTEHITGIANFKIDTNTGEAIITIPSHDASLTKYGLQARDVKRFSEDNPPPEGTEVVNGKLMEKEKTVRAPLKEVLPKLIGVTTDNTGAIFTPEFMKQYGVSSVNKKTEPSTKPKPKGKASQSTLDFFKTK